MSRPLLEMADVIRSAGQSFLERSRSWLTWQHLKVLKAIACCRTAALGGHRDQCSSCGYSAISYNSCRNRHCPKCQGNAPPSLAGGPSRGVTAYSLRACGLHPTTGTGAACPPEQKGHL